ncbi:MAG: MBL fold metallo-hydrolase, partial [Clostridia bacterium]|nr:MBL fold metallo-hydrolase [Clostridia bacterium]
CTMYAVVSDGKTALVDTGSSVDLDDLLPTLAAAGVGTASIARVLNTHTHPDHVGGNRTVKEQTGARTGCHQWERYFFDRGCHWASVSEVMCIPVEPFTFDFDFVDGDVLEVGRWRLRVVHTPGHSFGAVCFYDEATGALFAGDTMFREGFINVLPTVTGADCLFRHRQSLDRLRDLGVSWVFPGHGNPTDDFPGLWRACCSRIDQLVADFEESQLHSLRVGLIYRLYAEGGEMPLAAFIRFVLSVPAFQDACRFWLKRDPADVCQDIVEGYVRSGRVVIGADGSMRLAAEGWKRTHMEVHVRRGDRLVRTAWPERAAGRDPAT